MNQSKNILVTGGTGFIGSAISENLKSSGFKVISISRENQYDFAKLQDPTTWLKVLKEHSIDLVINAVGIIAETKQQSFAEIHTQAPISLFSSCVTYGVKRVIQISALGADEAAFSKYHLSKKAADDYLLNCKIDSFVLRPSLVYGENGDSTKMLTAQAKLPMTPVFNNGDSQIQPIHIDDVVEAVNTCVHAEITENESKVIDLVGPEIYSMREYFSVLKGKPIRALNIPVGLMLALCPIIEKFKPMINSESIQMLLQGNVADVSGITKLLGRSPKSIKAFL